MSEERKDRRKADYTDRPLTEDERVFAGSKENHNQLFKFMKRNRLDPEEWYDILVIPYLNAVKKYCSRQELQIYPFSKILEKKLSRAVYEEYRKSTRQKRIPADKMFSLDYTVEGDNPYSEHTLDEMWIDRKTSVEKTVILKEMFKEFYEKCTTYEADDIYDGGEINEYVKCELDLLLQGYTHKQVNRMTEKKYYYGYDVYDLERTIEDFRKVFKEVFGI